MQRNLDNFYFVENLLLKTSVIPTGSRINFSKLGFAQTVVLEIRKSDGFREHYENEPEMAVPRLEANIWYL